MNTYLILLRGINVGGKNKVPMAKLKTCLEELGFTGVSTYIASGNAIVKSTKSAQEVKVQIEETLPKCFKLDSKLIKILVLTHKQLKVVVDTKPKGFGDQPGMYHSDVIFLMELTSDEVMPIFSPREGVDKVWPGTGVVYSQRLSELRAKSRLSKIMGNAAYKSMTIRTWNTTLQLLKLLEAA